MQEVIGLTLLVLGVLLLLALISYTPGDVPLWFPLSHADHPSKATHNFVGSLGAIMACISYVLFGAASYLLAAALIGYGATAMLGRTMGFALRPLWTAGFVVSGACLLHVLGWSLIDRGRLHVSSEGGLVGQYIGGTIFATVFGPAAVLVLLLIYVVCIILMTGLRPIAVARRAMGIPGEWLETWRERQLQRATEEQRLVLEQKKMERERRRMERELSKRGGDAAPGEKYEQPELLPLSDAKESAPEPDLDRPAPKIFDASAPTAPSAASRKEKKKEKLQLLQTISSANYQLPSLDLLEPLDLSTRHVASHEELLGVQNRIIETLGEFGIAVTAGDITKGPTITRYEVYPSRGVRVDRIVNHERDLARATRAERINILAPIPGKDTVGIEIANSRKQMVTLRELLEGEDFHAAKARIPIALGKDVYGRSIIADLAAMPHGLVAGTTGSGKSVCINSIIASILYRFSPEDLRLIMIDPKVVEMQMYNTLPHLVVPVVTDPKKVLLALKWAVNEMEKRYAIFAKVGVRNITSFNDRPKPKSRKELDDDREARAAASKPVPPVTIDPAAEPVAASSDDILGKPFGGEPEPEVLNGDSEQYGTPTSEREEQQELGISVPRDDGIIIPEKMPFIVIIVDELADLMQTAPADVELLIARITQKARAAGIHMIIATQTPRADVITGVIKANVPCRIAFQVASPLDSRVILDENGAERLLGQGDLLYRPPGTSRLVRAQGVLVTDEEVRRIVEFVSGQSEQCFESEIHQKLESIGDGDDEEEVSDEDEEIVQKCLEVMKQEGKASTSLFQRRLRLGYTRAARILDILEQRGYVGPGDGAKPREILRNPEDI
ncbi:MAG: DNA translocase FtsK 4TM domain-containing protein [Chthoniobacteraceae bacterium]